MLVLIMPIIAEEYKSRVTANLEEFRRNWMLILWRALEKDNSTIVQQLSPLLCFVSVIVQEQQL